MALQSLQRSVQIRNYFVNYVNLLNNLRDGHFIFAHNGNLCELLTHIKNGKRSLYLSSAVVCVIIAHLPTSLPSSKGGEKANKLL